MPRAFTPKVITSNRLLEGDAVWFTAQDGWSPNIADAEFYTEEEVANARLAAANAQKGVIVGAYLADAVMGENGPAPTHFREEFRTRGPSNYAHGKQVDAQPAEKV